MSPHQPTTPDFETRVLEEFNAVLLEYCERARGRPLDPTRIEVVVTVVTDRSVRHLHDELGNWGHRILGRELAGARLGPVFFAVDEQLPAPHCQVAATDRLPGSQPRPPDGQAQPVQYPVLVLTLAFTAAYRYVYPLVTSQVWLPVRRGQPATDLRQEIPLPSHLYAVPEGPLLELRYWRGHVELRRVGVKAKYLVRVDGRPLLPGERAVLTSNGWIGYALGREQAVLDYVLRERE